jgi:hypothetical protein
MLLAFTDDSLNKARIDLLEGEVMRALAGHDKEALKDAIGLITRSSTVFAKQGHPFYQAKAAYELCLAFLYLAEFDAAATQIRIVQHVAKTTGDNSWKAFGLILASRHSLAQGLLSSPLAATKFLAKARQDATAAIGESDGHERRMKMCLIEALIARARALMAANNSEAARSDLVRALDQNEPRGGGIGNPKTYAACHLRLALVHANNKHVSGARAAFDNWKKVERVVEHRAIHDFANTVEEAISALEKDFVISHGENVLAYKEYEKRLRTFLIAAAERQVKAKHGKVTQDLVAKTLNISRVTLGEWSKPSTETSEAPRNVGARSTRR